LSLAQATKTEQEATQRLREALRDVRREGLSGAFTQKAADVATQVTVQERIFVGSVIYLVVIAAFPWGCEIFGWCSVVQAADQFAFRLLRTATLAAPGIWLGWSSSRKLAALNRVLADYEYKSATALAYESYRKEVDDAGNDSLREKLLATAIENFGFNPTRYYESTKSEPAAPTEAVAEKLIDKAAALATKAAEAAKIKPPAT
jgi:hypothetical protein